MDSSKVACRVGLTAAAALAIGGTVGAGSAMATGVQNAKVAACQGNGLSISQNLDDGNQAGMNHDGSYIVVTNNSLQTCTIKGYLSLQLLDAHHQPLRTSEAKGATYFASDPGAHSITLKSGQQAAADLVYVNGGVNPDQAVKPTYLQITTPGAKDGSFTIPFSTPSGIYQGGLATTALAAGNGA
jgi:hypothetical protein